MNRMRVKTIKRISNSIVLVLFMLSIITLLRFSELPNIFNLKWMEKPDSDSGVAISLATSFVVTAVFYFIMNFLPDLIWEKEIEESQYPRRKIVHREVYGYVEEFIKLWESIVKTSDSDFRATSVGELFRSKSMVTAIQGLDLLSKSSIPLIVSDGLVFATWTDVIIDRLTKMERRGEIILDRNSSILDKLSVFI